MPWPLLLWGAGALLATAIGGGAYLEYKEKQEADARRRARERAKRENDEENRKRQQAAVEKAKRINDEYDSNVHAEVLGELKGIREGLEDKGMSASSDLLQMERELEELKKKAMKKK